jgi:tetratricopeptide (TPR) repeat protein
MTASSQRAALDAVHSARPIVERLSTARHKEDLAADIIEAWTAVEIGLRSLVGGTTLAGQTLIRELRQRHFLSLEQANSLAAFNAARERAANTDYAPTEGDISAVRDAFAKLEAGLLAAPAAQVASPVAPPLAPTPTKSDDALRVAPPGRRNPLVLIGGILGVALVAALIWYFTLARSGHRAYDDGVVAYREGRREAAEGSFRKAVTDDPKDPMPHVYLSRIEREKGNLNNANEEARKAVELGPKNAVALRELGSVRFAIGDYDTARRFYLHALEADPADRTSMGFLGCSLIRLGRVDEGVKMIQQHAGTGAWSGCVPAPGAPAPTGQAANPSVPMTVPRP